MSYQAKLVMCNMLNIRISDETITLGQLRNEAIEATKKTSELASEYSDSKLAIKAMYSQDDPQREIALDDIKDEFEFLKAQAADYQSETEAKVSEKEASIKTMETRKDKLEEEIPEEAQKDHTYGFK